MAFRIPELVPGVEGRVLGHLVAVVGLGRDVVGIVQMNPVSGMHLRKGPGQVIHPVAGTDQKAVSFDPVQEKSILLRLPLRECNIYAFYIKIFAFRYAFDFNPGPGAVRQHLLPGPVDVVHITARNRLAGQVHGLHHRLKLQAVFHRRGRRVCPQIAGHGPEISEIALIPGMNQGHEDRQGSVVNAAMGLRIPDGRGKAHIRNLPEHEGLVLRQPIVKVLNISPGVHPVGNEAENPPQGPLSLHMEHDGVGKRHRGADDEGNGSVPGVRILYGRHGLITAAGAPVDIAEGPGAAVEFLSLFPGKLRDDGRRLPDPLRVGNVPERSFRTHIALDIVSPMGNSKCNLVVKAGLSQRHHLLVRSRKRA